MLCAKVVIVSQSENRHEDTMWERLGWGDEIPRALQLSRRWKKLGLFRLRGCFVGPGVSVPYCIEFKGDGRGTIWARWVPDQSPEAGKAP